MAMAWFKNSMACIAMISLQCVSVGSEVMTMRSVTGEMISAYVLIVYTLFFSTISAAVAAICVERNTENKITLKIFLRILIMAILGLAKDQLILFIYPSFTCGMTYVIPAMTFLVRMIAGICGRNIVDLRRPRSYAQVLGALATVAGAVTMAIYNGKGVPVISSAHTEASTNQHWFVGALCLIVSAFFWSIRFIVQESTLEEYQAPWFTSFLENLLGLVVSFVFAFFVERNNSSAWVIGFDINLLAAASAGIFSSVMTYVEIKYKGREFASAFIPLRIIIAAFMETTLYLGGIVGAVLIVLGQYSVIWGNYKESQEKEELLPTVVEDTSDGQ